MESIEIEVKNQPDIISTKEIPPISTKIKKKKKKSKKPKEKKCAGLKELLEQINQEKIEKIKSEEKVDKIKNETNSTEILIQNEDKNKDNIIKEHINIFGSFISGTTVATSSPDDCNEITKFNCDKFFDFSNKFEYLDLKPNYLIKNSELSEDDKNEEEKPYIRRKISSPIFDYYDGFDKILSETHKGSVDMTNSMNFIKKEDFINNSFINNNNYSSTCLDSNLFIKPEEINNYNDNNMIVDNKNDNNNDIKSDIMGNKNINNVNQDNINININNENELESINLENNNINIPYEEYNYYNIPYYQYMDYYNNIIPENIFYSKFNFDNSRTIQNPNSNIYGNRKYKKDKIKYKSNKNNNISIRQGDWLCNICSNLNFSFRISCNRCKAPKP